MIYLEELVDVILAEEGQVLMGIDFILDDLKLSMKKLEAVFVKSAREYSRRRPIEETRNFEVASTMLQLPSNVTAVRAVRFGVLDSMPRFFMPTLGQSGYEFERHTGILKVWPPISPIRVTYTREVEIKGSQSIELTYPMDSREDTLEEVLPTTFKSGTLTITKNSKTMSVVDTVDGVAQLEGNLGTGTIDTKTREVSLQLADTTANDLVIAYKSLYKCINDLYIGDEVFTKLFASKLLESVAAMRAQATQEELQHIDLTTDDLYERVRILKKEVNKLLRETISFGDMSVY